MGTKNKTTEVDPLRKDQTLDSFRFAPALRATPTDRCGSRSNMAEIFLPARQHGPESPIHPYQLQLAIEALRNYPYRALNDCFTAPAF